MTRATMNRGPGLLALCLATGMGAPLAAQIADPELSVLAGTCVTCHGPDGRSPGAIPSLAGRSAGELAAAMLAARGGAPETGTVMPRLMPGYSEAQIEALATWFSEVGQ